MVREPTSIVFTRAVDRHLDSMEREINRLWFFATIVVLLAFVAGYLLGVNA